VSAGGRRRRPDSGPDDVTLDGTDTVERWIRLLYAVAQASAMARKRPSMKAMATAGFCAVVAAAALVGALGAAIAALWLWVLPFLGPAGTALAMAIVMGLVAAGLIAVACKRMKPLDSEDGVTDPDIDVLLDEGLRIYRNHKGLALAAALVAGLASGIGKRRR